MGIKVLVVEDDNFLLKAYQAKLTASGFELQTAADGEVALHVLESFKPQVIVLDLVMPRKDGFATLEEIKKQPQLKDIPVIVATNIGQKEEVDRVMNAGAAECIIKSDLSLEELVHKIEKYAS
ncbi:MAG TPA: response regulator [Candidatus Saccharimonadales bacterium]|nr:response regulator [Candidatus Saccharimonadales bacterium]